MLAHKNFNTIIYHVTCKFTMFFNQMSQEGVMLGIESAHYNYITNALYRGAKNMNDVYRVFA